MCFIALIEVGRYKGGLGVRDIRLVNYSLLAKWRWRILEEKPSLWKEVLEDLYGPLVRVRSLVEGVVWPRKDLMALEDVGEVVRKGGG